MILIEAVPNYGCKTVLRNSDMRVKLQREWELFDQIGSGGFGRVYAARSSDGKDAVAKLVPKDPGAQRELLFVDLDDVRNIVPVIDSGETAESWVLVMPRAEKSLRQHLQGAAAPLHISDTIAILSEVAEALSELDGRVVHRDLKAENVLWLDGRWRLADFGISRYAEATTAPDTQKLRYRLPMLLRSAGVATGRPSLPTYIRSA